MKIGDVKNGSSECVVFIMFIDKIWLQFMIYFYLLTVIVAFKVN